MVDFVSIDTTLNKLDGLYYASSDTQMNILYSKLSVLELCGWIEISVDTILNEYVDSHILNIDNCKKIRKIINNTYGFDYEKHLFPLFSSVIGINNLENILDVITPTDLSNLISLTNTYSVIRNKAAHTDTPNGTTRTYNSPSIVLNDYRKIKGAIKTLEDEVQKL